MHTYQKLKEFRMMKWMNFHTEVIPPGHRTICSAKVNLEINNKGQRSRTVKAKLDSCGSVSIAHENLMTEIKPAGKYNLPPIRL